MPSRPLLTLAIVCTLVATSMTAASTAQSAPVLCSGHVADFVGTAGVDHLVGTSAPEVFAGLGGNDTIEGRGGNDVICGGGGNDVIDGGNGKDIILGGPGKDNIAGSGGNDRIKGANGADVIRAGGGKDTVWGGDGGDRVDGGWGDDTLRGESGKDTLIGNAGDDTAKGGAHDDECAADHESGCEYDPNDFRVERLLINQAVPSADSDLAAPNRIPAVAARSGVLRAFVSAARSVSGASPKVVLHWRKNGNSGQVTLDGPNAVPVNPSEATLTDTHNWVFGDGFLREGGEVYIEIDPANKHFESDESNNRWPASGWYDLSVNTVPLFGVTLVPIKLNGDTAQVTTQSAAALLSKTERVFPIAASRTTIRSAYAFNGSTQGDWSTLLYEIAQLRSADGSTDLYLAVLPGPISGGIGGIGFIGAPAAVAIQSEGVIAHEVGHTLSLPHAPCGGPSGVDANYPYPGASIGTWGYDFSTGFTYNPASYTDLMSYCNPTWVSDYNYNKVLSYRSGSYGAAQAVAAGHTALTVLGAIEEPTLEAWSTSGGVTTATIESVIEVDVHEHQRQGTHTLVGLDSDGRVVASTSFEPLEYHLYGAGGHEDRTVIWTQLVVPDADVDRLVEYRVIHDGTMIGRGWLPASSNR